MENPIVFFDGVCNLCNQSVQFIIRHDPKQYFKFAALQSAFAKEILKPYHIDTTAFQSIVYLEGNKVYQNSDAVLHIARHLNKGYKFLYIFRFVPRFIRDALYKFIAKNRYKWMGKKEACMIPTPALKERFLA